MNETRRPIPPEAAAHLARADGTMGGLIERVGPIDYAVDPDPWRGIVGSIVGQQLSVLAARTIRGRVAALGANGFPTPAELLETPEERLLACGLSRAKASYVQGAARAWLEGVIDSESLSAASDDEVITRLVALRGVGRWTAEMVLIFSLGRPDILAVDDLGIRAAVQKAYGLDERPDRSEVFRIGEAWSPYRSFASLYLWRSLNTP